MINMTIGEVKELNTGKYSTLEVYRSINSRRHSFHTDSIEGYLFEPQDYDNDTKIIKYNLMDKEEYGNTILANSNLSVDELGDEFFPILCILI